MDKQEKTGNERSGKENETTRTTFASGASASGAESTSRQDDEQEFQRNLAQGLEHDPALRKPLDAASGQEPQATAHRGKAEFNTDRELTGNQNAGDRPLPKDAGYNGPKKPGGLDTDDKTDE